MYPSRYGAVALLALVVGFTFGHPLNSSDIEERQAAGGGRPCDLIADKTTSYFLGTRCKKPPASTCLFYTMGLSKQAKVFSKANGADLTTIWEMWPKSFYVKTQATNNPLRCIMGREDERQKYFETMSESMAISCDIFATVLDPNPDDVLLNGIWGRIEFPALMRSGNEGTVNSIEAINPEGTKNKQVWARSASKRNEDLPESSKYAHIFEREDCGTDDDVAADFDEGGGFPVDW